MDPCLPLKSRSFRGGGWRLFPGNLTMVALSQISGWEPLCMECSLLLPPASPPYVFLNLWYWIQLARPGIQLKMLSDLAQK